MSILQNFDATQFKMYTNIFILEQVTHKKVQLYKN